MSRRRELSDALLRIVAERGMDEVSVREVAAEAGVSIGTVQHYFPTKDAMLAGAFEAVVDGVRSRLAALPLGADVRQNLGLVLRELLPLDARRHREVVVQLAFSVRAIHAPALADIQRQALGELHAALVDAFRTARGGARPSAADDRAAHLVLAAADGLALHAVSAPGWLSPAQVTAIVDGLLTALITDAARGRRSTRAGRPPATS